MLGLLTAPREDSGVSPAEPLQEHFIEQLWAGVPCVAPLRLQQLDPGPSAPAPLPSATFVYVRSLPAAPSLTLLYHGPFEVIKKVEKFFVLKIGGRFDAISVDCLKPHLSGPNVPVDPPRCGRPPVTKTQVQAVPSSVAVGTEYCK
jgi:hypothetical protein